MTWARPVPLIGDTTSAAQRAGDPRAWRFDEATRSAFYDVVAARRDIRRFRADEVPGDIVTTVLRAAHMAPSVGHSQPWRFVVVRSAQARERAALIAERERLRQASLLDEDAGRRMLDLQLDGIREAPIGIVVGCDRRVAAAGVIGRATFPDTDLWSCACAIENLWLAARAEGLGLGWVTLFPPVELAGLVGAPEGVETLGWLCLGWPDERPPEPGLQRAGWSRRAPLASVVLDERWPEQGPPPPPSALRAPDQAAVVHARDGADDLLSPPGSLGVLDRALDRLAALGIEEPHDAHLVLVAADHPVTRHGVSAYPSGVTREVLEATVVGGSVGAAAARAADLSVVAIDAGVSGGPIEGALSMRPQGQRGDLVSHDALAPDDVRNLIERGRRLGHDLPGNIILLGEVGIGNTTVAAALAAAFLKLRPDDVVGLGAGGDSDIIGRKKEVVARSLERAQGRHGCYDLFAAVGGPELAILTGVVLGAAGRAAAVVLDGFATSVAALGAVKLAPGVAANLVAAQRSREKAHVLVLQELGLEPLLDIRLRSGEGVGAVLGYQLIATAMKMRSLAGRVSEALNTDEA